MNFAGKVERMPSFRLRKKLVSCFPTDQAWKDYKSGTASTLSYGKSLGSFWPKISDSLFPEEGVWGGNGVYQMQPGRSAHTEEQWREWENLNHNTHIHNKMREKEEWKRIVKEAFWEFGE